MDDMKDALINLCRKTCADLDSLELTNKFIKIPIDNANGIKSKIDLQKFIPKHFIPHDYTFDYIDKKHARFNGNNIYNQKINIDIIMYDPCWRLEYYYTLHYIDYWGQVSYFCNFEKDLLDVDGALENMVAVTKYIQEKVEKEFDLILQKN